MQLTRNSRDPLLRLAPAKTKMAKQERLPASSGANTSTTIFTATGAGVVRNLWCAVQANVFSLDGRLQILVDGEASPSIDIDFGTLFLFHNEGYQQAGGFALSTAHWHGEVPGGSTPQISGWLGFPIPYSNGITIRMLNPTGVSVGATNLSWWEVTYQPDIVLPYRLKSFGHSQAAPGASATTACPAGSVTVTSGATQSLADISPGKAGWLAWIGLCEKSTSSYSYLERNVQITVDSEGTPAFVSSGTEDLFFGSFYYQARKSQSTGVAVATAVNQTAGTGNQGLDVLALCDGIRFDSRLQVDLLTEAQVVTDHTMAWLLLYYTAI
jgi:hypothetical protein